MDELLPQVAVTPETVAGVIAGWRTDPTVPPLAGGPDPAQRSEGGATQPATAAEADLEPDRPVMACDAGADRLRPDGDLRQKLSHQPRLARLQGAVLAAPEEAQGLPGQNAPLRVSARSVRSQLNPPSSSGVRPKWP